MFEFGTNRDAGACVGSQQQRGNCSDRTTFVQFVPESVEYCHVPLVELVLVIADALRVARIGVGDLAADQCRNCGPVLLVLFYRDVGKIVRSGKHGGEVVLNHDLPHPDRTPEEKTVRLGQSHFRRRRRRHVGQRSPPPP